MARNRSMQRTRNRRNKRCHSRGKRGGMWPFGNSSDSPEMKSFKAILKENKTIRDTLEKFPDDEQKIDDIPDEEIKAIAPKVKNFYTNLKGNTDKFNKFNEDIEKAKKKRFYNRVINKAMALPGEVPAPREASAELGVSEIPPVFGLAAAFKNSSPQPTSTLSADTIGMVIPKQRPTGGPGGFFTPTPKPTGQAAGKSRRRRRHSRRHRRRTNKIQKSRKGRKMRRN